MLDSFQSSSKSEPYVAIFSPLEHPPQGQPASKRVEGLPPEGQDASSAPAKRKRRAWAPDADDHLIYRWAKLDGKGQEFVAQCFGISQSTVSRIVQRYERWQAHAEARDDGRLDPAERLRAQRWLAYERNEAMISSCLRLASEVEGSRDVSRSVTSRPLSSPSAENTLRTEWSVLDRTGMAARFLRLAFRINQEQVKLTEAAPPPLPEPLSEEEIAEQETLAAEERAEIAAVRNRNTQEVEATQVSLMDQLQAARHEAAEARREAAAAREELKAARTGGRATRGTPDEPPTDEPDLHNLHNLHTGFEPETDASAEAAGSYDAQPPEKKMPATCLHIPLPDPNAESGG